MSVLGWCLLIWAVLSAIATPFVGRLVASRLGDHEPEQTPSPKRKSEPAGTEV
jgi:hypothetical protein